MFKTPAQKEDAMRETAINVLIFTLIVILAAGLVSAGEYLGLRSVEIVNYFTDVF